MIEELRRYVNFNAHQEFPAKFVSCRVKGKIWTFAAMAIW